jgi:hypothetical protein
MFPSVDVTRENAGSAPPLNGFRPFPSRGHHVIEGQAELAVVTRGLLAAGTRGPLCASHNGVGQPLEAGLCASRPRTNLLQKGPTETAVERLLANEGWRSQGILVGVLG